MTVVAGFGKNFIIIDGASLVNAALLCEKELKLNPIKTINMVSIRFSVVKV